MKNAAVLTEDRGICPLFSSPPWGFWQLKSPHRREFAIQGKTNANAQGSARGKGGEGVGARGIDWYIKTLIVTLYGVNYHLLA